MKQISEELQSYLHKTDGFYMCDLYEITLTNGQISRYADYGTDIILKDGRIFSSKSPAFTREGTKTPTEINVAKMNLTLDVDDSDQINNIPIMRLAHNGGLDNATLTLYRCFMNDPGVVVGTIEMFSGYIDVKSGGGLSLELEIKSSIQLLNINYPTRKYYPHCPWQVYGAGCGVNKALFTKTGTVTRDFVDAPEFYTNLSFPDGYYNQGVIEWTSGVLNGTVASVKRSYQANGGIILLIAPETAPAAGDKFIIYPGCDKSPKTCRDKFNNFLRNRATPYIPLKETIV